MCDRVSNMVVKCLLISLILIITPTRGKPEAPLPYYYTAPSVDQNVIDKSSSQTPSSGQTYIPIPGNSYGTPLLKTTSKTSQIQNAAAILPSRNYGGPNILYSSETPNAAYRGEPQIRIQKHIYVHVAPPDVEEPTQRIQQQPIRQKHYKIIFLKVPSYPAPAPYVAQPQALQEEKTLIYVLVKKPEATLAVPASQVASVPISKPEVYFVKYKAKSGQSTPIVGQGFLQQTESVRGGGDSDSVVIESAAGGNQGQGYSYDRPGAIVK